MRLENTDRFKNKMCVVTWKNKTSHAGRIKYYPNYSSKYDYHQPGWFLVEPENDDEQELIFRDILEIIVLY